jgi:hypothetical protein
MGKRSSSTDVGLAYRYRQGYSYEWRTGPWTLRPGVFGSSRLLSNVNGGSNYIYTYTYIESAI